PTRATSPRQLPTDHVHAVSTRAYQCDQSSRLPPGSHRHCCPEVFPFALQDEYTWRTEPVKDSRRRASRVLDSLCSPPKTAPLIKAKGKTSSDPHKIVGLDRVAPYQLADGNSARATTSASAGLVRASRRNPSCC